MTPPTEDLPTAPQGNGTQPGHKYVPKQNPPPPNATNTSDSGEAGWERLDAKVIWVDLARMFLSLVPMAVTTLVFGGAVDGSVLWPAAIIAVTGVAAAASDLLRWVKTRYRVTEERLEVRTGLLVRSHRSVRRDRIRSVDTTARLRHRLAGLRVVAIRAGDRTATGESTPLRLDAVSTETAARLQADLPAGSRTGSATGSETEAQAGAGGLRPPVSTLPVGTDGSARPRPDRVIATFRWGWVPYNAFTVWAFLTAAGLGWGAHWLGQSMGIDLAGFVLGLVDWNAVGTVWTVVIAVVAAGAFGVVGVGAAFVAEKWHFRLVRAETPTGTVLRTGHGLFRTRQVDRDDDRLRGVEIRRPLLWRWSRMAETSVVSTGLGGTWSTASAILPRARLTDARRVAGAVLRDERPLAAPLDAHPPAALRRRIGWAVLVSGVATGALWWTAPGWWWLVGVGLLPVALGLAVLAYRSLGHALVGPHLVTSSGLNRSTVVLRRGAVIGVTLRQSVPQRRLGLVTMRATTAAGRGSYATPDLRTGDGVTLADAVVPGLLAPYKGEMTDSHPTVRSAALPDSTRPGN